MKKLRNTARVLSIVGLVLFLVILIIKAAEIKIALDCPPDPQKCGTYVWSHAFAEHLKANGLAAVEHANQNCCLPLSTQRRLLPPVSRKLSFDHHEHDFGVQSHSLQSC